MKFSKQTMIISAAAVAATTVVLTVSACGAEEAAKKKVKTTTGDVTAAYPGELAIAAFPQTTEETTAALKLQPGPGGGQPPPPPTIAEKVEEAKEILEGKADDCIPAAMKQAMRDLNTESCYEFDHDMIKTTMPQGLGAGAIGTLDGKNSEGEACLVAFGRSKIDQAVDIVDRSTGMIAAMICQAKKKNENLGLPKKVGGKLDLKSALETAFSGEATMRGKMTITEASIERLEDSEDGHPVFKSHVVMSDGFTNAEREVNIVHSPLSANDNSEFRGTLWTRITTDNPLRPMDSGKQRVLSIVYNKTVENGQPKIKYELRTASIATALTPFEESGVVNFNTGASFTGSVSDPNYGAYTGYQQANMAVGNITYIAFDLNPNTNEGTLAYWQNPGGNYLENARGMVFKLEKDTDGTLKGCASSGSASINQSGVSIRRVMHEGESATVSLTPRGYWHPLLPPNPTCTDDSSTYAPVSVRKCTANAQIWAVPIPSVTDNAAKFSSFVQNNSGGYVTQQCFKQNATTGVYELDTAAMDNEAKAGYTLIDTGNPSDLGRMIQPPNMADVKPFQGPVNPAP